MPEEALHGASRTVATSKNSSVCDGENIPGPKSFWVFFVGYDQAIKQIFIFDFSLRVVMFLNLSQSSSSDESVFRGEEGNVLPKWISSENVVEPWYLSNEAVIPLGVVNGLDCTVDVNTCFQETEFLGESNLP